MEEKQVPVKVAVRVRPFVGKERLLNPGCCLSLFPSKKQLVLGKDRHFTFDHLFSQEDGQDIVYNSCVKQLVEGCFKGYNATVFAYGQTGSGKTYTMGTDELSGIQELRYGVLPRAVKEIFTRVEETHNKFAGARSSTTIKVSFIEVYMEEVRDLLGVESAERDLRIQEDEHGNTVVPGIHEEIVTTVEEVLSLLAFGAAARHTGNTKMNEDSSRSHCIFTLSLEKLPQTEAMNLGAELSQGGNISAKFKVIDLAGSERAHRTGNQGERFKESVFINTGLLALGNVISALSDSKRKNSHIPYRDSKLTRLLKESLGGNSNTVMITCLSPCTADLDENLNSLKFSTRARKICNAPVINRELQEAQFTQMKDEIAALRQELKRHYSAPPGALQKVMLTPNASEIEHLRKESKRYRDEINYYSQQMTSANELFTKCERSSALSDQLQEQILQWRNATEAFRRNGKAVQSESVSTLGLSVASAALHRNGDAENDLETLRETLKQKSKENDGLRTLVNSLQADIARLLSEVASLSEERCCLKNHLLEQQHRMFKDVEASDMDVSLNEEEKLMKSFRARSEVLISRIEDLDEVCRDSSDVEGVATSIAERDVLENRKSATAMHNIAMPNWKQTGVASAVNKQTDAGVETVSANDMSAEPSRLGTAAPSRSETSGKELGIVEQCIRDFTEQLSTLTTMIHRKEELIEVISRNEASANELAPTLEERYLAWKKDIDRVSKDLCETQRRLKDIEKRSLGNTEDRLKIENDYKAKISRLEERLAVMEKTHGDAKKLYSFTGNSERKISDLEGHVERLRSQQDELNRKLKAEKDRKLKLEAEVKRGEQKIKELQLKTDGQQRILKRKTEEVAAVQRKLRIGSGKSEKTSSRIEEQKKLLDSEIDAMLKRKEEMNQLESELKKRQETLEKREALLVEKGIIESKKVRSSQVLLQDILRLSTTIDDINNKIAQKEKKVLVAKDKDKIKEELSNLLGTKAELERNQQTIEKRLESDHILDDLEEEKLKEVIDGIEAVDVAIAYKSDLINERRNSLKMSMATEDWINQLLSKLGEISLDESKGLLRRYLEKVATLKESESRAKLEREMLEVQIEEQDLKIHQLQHFLQLTEDRAAKTRVDLQLQYEEQIQLLLAQLKENSQSKAEGDNRGQERKIHLLEKELHYYKKTCRDLKKRLRDAGDANVQDSIVADRSPHCKSNERRKNGAEMVKEEHSKQTGSSQDISRSRSGIPLEEAHCKVGNELYSLNNLSRDSETLTSARSRNLVDNSRDDIVKGSIGSGREGAESFRLPPVQGSSRELKQQRSKDYGPGSRGPVERQASEDSQILKDIFEAHLSQRIARKETRPSSEQDLSSRKKSLQRDSNQLKAHEDCHETGSNPWQ